MYNFQFLLNQDGSGKLFITLTYLHCISKVLNYVIEDLQGKPAFILCLV